MAARITSYKTVKTDADKQACADLSVMCALSVAGLLIGLVALLQGLMASSFIPTGSSVIVSSGGYYWLVVIMGIWLPALGLMGSIIGVTIRNQWALPVLLMSPLISIIGYCLYSYVPLSHIV